MIPKPLGYLKRNLCFVSSTPAYVGAGSLAVDTVDQQERYLMQQVASYGDLKL
jgi:hypothetical protein